jgi:hypothetical protein
MTHLLTKETDSVFANKVNTTKYFLEIFAIYSGYAVKHLETNYFFNTI